MRAGCDAYVCTTSGKRNRKLTQTVPARAGDKKDAKIQAYHEAARKRSSQKEKNPPSAYPTQWAETVRSKKMIDQTCGECRHWKPASGGAGWCEHPAVEVGGCAFMICCEGADCRGFECKEQEDDKGV